MEELEMLLILPLWTTMMCFCKIMSINIYAEDSILTNPLLTRLTRTE